MTTQPHRSAGAHALVAAWLVLLFAWGSGTTFNVYHATHTGHMRLALALLAGVIPALLSMCLSHIVASYNGGKFMTVVTFAVMIGAMAMSIGATAAVLGGTFGWMGWLYGGVLDAASLLALQVILNGAGRKAAAEAVLESARAAAEKAIGEATQAQAAVAEATAVHDRLAAELAAARAEVETAVAAVRSELEAEVQALTSALNDARNKARSSAQKRRASSPRNKAPASPLNPDVLSDFDTQAEALKILAEEPGISGGELGLRLGKSKRYGCILRNRLAPSVPGPDQATE